MKKWIKILGIIILFGIASLALAKAEFDYIKLPDGATNYIYGGAIKNENMTLIRIVDGKNTCYTVITKVNNLPVNTAISCVN